MDTWASIAKKGMRSNGDVVVNSNNNNTILYTIRRWGYVQDDDFGHFAWIATSSERDEPEEDIKYIFNHQGYYILGYKPFGILVAANTWAQIQQIITRTKLKDCSVTIYICKSQGQRNNMLNK